MFKLVKFVIVLLLNIFATKIYAQNDTLRMSYFEGSYWLPKSKIRQYEMLEYIPIKGEKYKLNHYRIKQIFYNKRKVADYDSMRLDTSVSSKIIYIDSNFFKNLKSEIFDTTKHLLNGQQFKGQIGKLTRKQIVNVYKSIRKNTYGYKINEIKEYKYINYYVTSLIKNKGRFTFVSDYTNMFRFSISNEDSVIYAIQNFALTNLESINIYSKNNQYDVYILNPSLSIMLEKIVPQKLKLKNYLGIKPYLIDYIKWYEANQLEFYLLENQSSYSP